MNNKVHASRIAGTWDEGIAFSIADNNEDLFARWTAHGAAATMVVLLVAWCMSVR